MLWINPLTTAVVRPNIHTMRGEVLKGHLDMLLLAAVRDGATHGYAIIERMREQSSGVIDLPEGTIYPALHRLERYGALRSSWAATGARRRRVYALTTLGRRLLTRQRKDWHLFTRAIHGVLGPA
jgi:DNA-binding PadR family transcriptional regulator